MPLYRPRALLQLHVIFEADGEFRPEQGFERSQSILGPVLTQDAAFKVGDEKSQLLALPILAVPHDMTVTRNTLRKADTLDASFDYLRLPMDPRSIRSMRVTAFLADAEKSGEVYAKVGAILDSVVGPGASLATLPFQDLLRGLTPKDVAFIGMADSTATSLSQSASDVKIKARDYTSFWLDKKVPQVNAQDSGGKVARRAKQYEIDRPFYDVVLEMFEDIGPSVRQLREEFRKTYASAPSTHPTRQVLAQHYGHSVFVPDNGDNMWDLLSVMCDMLPALPYFELDSLRIERTADTTRSRTPYVFEYGRNVTDLKYESNLKDGLTRPVELRCFNADAETKSARIITARFPENGFEGPVPMVEANNLALASLRQSLGNLAPVADAARTILPTDVTVDNPVTGSVSEVTTSAGKVSRRTDDVSVLHLTGNYTESQVQAIAEDIFIRARREEITGSFTTYEMQDLPLQQTLLPQQVQDLLEDGPGIDVGSLDFAGRSIGEGTVPVVQIGSSDVIFLSIGRSDWQSMWSLSTADAIQQLINNGIDPVSAESIILGARAAERILRPLYVRKAVHKFSSDNGYSLNIDFSSTYSGTDLET